MISIRVTLPENSYDIRVGLGLFREAPAILQEVAPASAYAIISDTRVGRLYGKVLHDTLTAAGHASTLVTFPEGEPHKTPQTWLKLTNVLGEKGFGRDCVILGLGGGVVGDLAGFVAATYRRGVPVVQIPTSLLAMIDAAIGGKTGVDTPHGKNLIGAFHHPRGVLADVTTLTTLDDRHFRAGIAEALKHGAISDGAFFRAIVDNAEPLEARDEAAMLDLVYRSAAIKAAIVTEDPWERGQRAVLNFGHSFGHAMEAASGYALLHGEAIAAGMVLEAKLAEHLGLASDLSEQIESAVRRFGLGEVPDGLETEALLTYLRQDKKNRSGAVRFALLTELGRMPGDDVSDWTVEVSQTTIKQFLAQTI